MSPGLNHEADEKDPTRYGGTSIAFFLSIVLVFVLARLWRLTSSCLWFDEIFSVHATRHSWPGLIKFAAADIIHPPLFYALLKIWIAIGGESLFWLRLLPFLFSLATVLPFWLLCRELSLKPAETNVALLLMAVSGFQIKYAQEVRMYSLLLFLSVFSLLLFLRLLRADSPRRKQLIALTAINLLLVYTHYYGWVMVFVQGLIVLLWRRKQLLNFLLSMLVLIIAYVPWIHEVVISREPGRGLAQNLGWIPRPGLRDVLQFFVVASKPFLFSQSSIDRVYDALSAWVVLLLFALPMIWLLCQTFRANKNREAETWLIVFALAPVFLAFMMSWILPYPVWGMRHLIICAPPLTIVMALAILRLRVYWMRIAILVMVGCWFLFAAVIFVIKPAPVFTWCAWGQLERQIPAPEDQSAAQIYTFEDLAAYHLWFAGTQDRQARFNVTVIKNVPGLVEDPAFFLPRRFDEIKVGDLPQIRGEKIWLAFRARRWDESRPPISFATSMGYQRGNVLSIKAQGEEVFMVEFRKTNQ